MPFSFLYKPQSHKTNGGYFINHDNLALATPEERRKLIFYFIACQNNEKLDPVDRVKFQMKYFSEVFFMPKFLGIATGALAIWKMPSFSTKYYARGVLNFVTSMFAAYFFYTFTENIVSSYLEPKFIEKNDVVNQLSKKYNFTVFDFAESKREAYLKNFRNEVVAQVSILQQYLFHIFYDIYDLCLTKQIEP